MKMIIPDTVTTRSLIIKNKHSPSSCNYRHDNDNDIYSNKINNYDNYNVYQNYRNSYKDNKSGEVI